MLSLTPRADKLAGCLGTETVRQKTQEMLLAMCPVMCFCRIREKNKPDVQIWAENESEREVWPYSHAWLYCILRSSCISIFRYYTCVNILTILFFPEVRPRVCFYKRKLFAKVLVCIWIYVSAYKNTCSNLEELETNGMSAHLLGNKFECKYEVTLFLKSPINSKMH